MILYNCNEASLLEVKDDNTVSHLSFSEIKEGMVFEIHMRMNQVKSFAYYRSEYYFAESNIFIRDDKLCVNCIQLDGASIYNE